MRNYQRKKNNPYWLRPRLYQRIRLIIEDYEVFKLTWLDLVEETITPDGMPKGNSTSDPTAAKAVKAELLRDYITAIEQGIKAVPEFYRQGVWAHVFDRVPFPCASGAGSATWFRYQARFIYEVAKKLGEI